MCFEYFYALTAKGVCVAHSLDEDNLPRKVKLSVVNHRCGCKLGLCTNTTLATFRYKNPKHETAEEKEALQKERKEHGHYQWTSCETPLNMDKLIKNKGNATVKITVAWRRPFNGQPPPAFITMKSFLNQVWEDVANERPFVFRLWVGEYLPVLQTMDYGVQDEQQDMGYRECEEQQGKQYGLDEDENASQFVETEPMVLGCKESKGRYLNQEEEGWTTLEEQLLVSEKEGHREVDEKSRTEEIEKEEQREVSTSNAEEEGREKTNGGDGGHESLQQTDGGNEDERRHANSSSIAPTQNVNLAREVPWKTLCGVVVVLILIMLLLLEPFLFQLED